MKKLAVILCLTALTTGAFAQGLVNFLNNSSMLISVGDMTSAEAIPAGQGAAYWFALLSAAPDSSDPHTFTFAGVTATNMNAAAGRILGGTGLVVDNWAAGETKAFLVVGWSADQGTVFDPAWMEAGNVDTGNGMFAGTPGGMFGVSAIAPGGVAGGGPTSIPPLNLFGGTQGLQSGFTLVPVPEPATMALAGLAAALLIFRRRS